MTWLKSLVLVLRAHLFISGFLVFLVSAQREPKHTVNSFHNPPSRLFFFDDTTSVIYHDGIAGDVYVSHDEGKSWDRAEDIPKGYATMVFEHPFEKNYAFVLSSEKTHYRTTNRGKTWTKFEMPYEPTMAVAPLSFHSDPSKYGHILYQGTKCESTGGWGAKCKDVTYYTTDAFGDDPKLLLEDTINCHFAHSSTAFKHEAHPDLIYCVAFDSSSHSGSRSSDSRRLFSSTDFFNKEKKMEDLGIGKQAKGVIAFAIVSKYAVVALKDSSHGEMMLFVTVDTKTWAKAQFPHASSAKLRENAYTLVESTTYSLAVDVVLQDYSAIGTLFVSNSNGTFFVQSLKDTNRNNYGYVDYEKIYGIEGVGLANIVSNAKDVEGRRAPKKLKTFITFDDGSNWYRVTPPELDNTGGRINCNPSNEENCSLHLHSVTALNNYGRVFSSPAPGLVMGIGSIGDRLLPYQECDTFLSTDGGLTWVMAKKEAHKHQIGGLGSIIVVVNDEEGVDKLSYSLDFGKSWKEYNFGVKLRAKGLTTLQDSTSQAFLLLGQVARKDRKDDLKSIAVIQLDFKDVFPRKCEDNDYEKWYARSSPDDRCFMGHQQWYMRRKQDADCYVDKKFEDPVGHDDPCKCTDADYECDYNYIRRGKECVAAGPEQVPQGVCTKPNQKYLGSSGYRKIPGNNCKGGIEKDKKVEKDCSEAQPEEGNIIHKTFEFPSQIIQHAYFNQSKTILVRLMDHTMWQSSNEGYTWEQLYPNERFLVFYHHKHNPDSAYLITSSRSLYVTTNVGQDWQKHEAPTLPNHLGLQVLRFHPDTEKLIWIGMEECPGPNCRVVAHSSRDNGRRWDLVEQYVRNCAWVRDHSLNADPTEILCESYRDKQGNQDRFKEENPLELVAGRNYFKDKKKVFDHVVGFAKFSEYLVVAELLPDKHAIDLQVSLDGIRFATGQFPPNIRPEAHAYTILESSTGSLFFHMTMSEPPAPYWGSILKSNGNGTYFGTSLDYVNRNEYGFVDFEKMAGLDGIALVNVVSNPSEATFSGQKQLRTKITHNDGSIWKPLNPPKTDSFGQKYECDDTSCALHIHGYTERRDPRATYSSPSAVGILMAVGNVGKHLAPYHESDTFLSRDAGFTWEEVHKGAHLWEFGDSGSILVMADDEQPTDQILFSKDEGLTWHEYKFADEKIRVGGIVTVPSDTSRKFIVIGTRPRSSISVAVHIDFSALTLRQCQLSEDDPAHDDFELWTPSIEREEICLFGRKVTYHRRKRDVDCIVGTKRKPEVHVENCACKAVDFECEFNYVKNKNDECVLVEGTIPNPSDDSCKDGASYWYERTAYRKISYSSCQGGVELDHGTQHVCPGFSAHGPLFWMFTIMIPFSFTALVGYYYYRRSGLARGTIRLPADSRNPYYNDSGALATLASVPWFLFGLASIAWEWVAEQFDNVAMRTRRGYRHVPMEQDAQILRFEDEDG